MKHVYVLEDSNRGRKVIVVTSDPDFSWGRWLRRNRGAMEAAEAFSKADATTRETLREFLGSMGIELR